MHVTIGARLPIIETGRGSAAPQLPDNRRAVRVLSEEGLDHYGIAMQDPEGNEFDIN